MDNEFLTVGEVARLLEAPQWRVRRTVDRLDANVPRMGQYRAVHQSMIKRIAAELGEHELQESKQHAFWGKVVDPSRELTEQEEDCDVYREFLMSRIGG